MDSEKKNAADRPSVDGRIVVENSRVTFADEAAVVDKVQAIGEALVARTRTRVLGSRWPVD